MGNAALGGPVKQRSLPLHCRDDIHRPVVLPNEFQAIVVSAHQVVRAMGQAGWLSRGHVDKGIPLLGRNHTATGTTCTLREEITVHLDVGQLKLQDRHWNLVGVHVSQVFPGNLRGLR